MPSGVSVQVEFHANLKKAFGEKSTRVSLGGPPTVGALLDAVSTTRERREMIFDESGGLRRDLTVLRNGRSIAFLSGADTELSDGDVVALFPPTFGG